MSDSATQTTLALYQKYTGFRCCLSSTNGGSNTSCSSSDNNNIIIVDVDLTKSRGGHVWWQFSKE